MPLFATLICAIIISVVGFWWIFWDGSFVVSADPRPSSHWEIRSFGCLCPTCDTQKPWEDLEICIKTWRRKTPKHLPSSKRTWQWKFTFSNRNYIFNWWIFHCRRVGWWFWDLKQLWIQRLCGLKPHSGWSCLVAGGVEKLTSKDKNKCYWRWTESCTTWDVCWQTKKETTYYSLLGFCLSAVIGHRSHAGWPGVVWSYDQTSKCVGARTQELGSQEFRDHLESIEFW